MRDQKNSKHPDRTGFTLIEVMIGIMIITFVLLPTFAVLKSGFRLTDSSRSETNASQIAESEMENLRALNYSELQTDYLNSSQPVDLTSSIDPSQQKLYGKSFTVSGQFNVLQQSKQGQLGEAEVYLTVHWKDDSGIKRILTYYTSFSEKGLSDYVATGF